MRVLLPLLIAAALLAGCSSRERANPLDPANPVSGGRPMGFNAVAGFDVVSLSWTAQPALAIDGFLLERLAPGDSLYRPVGSVFPPAVGGALDLATSNGSTYRYRLYYVIHGSPAHLPAEDLATPGPLRPWVADAGSGTLLRLSPDGRDVIGSFHDAGAIQSLAVDPSDGRVWTSARLDGIVSSRLPGDIEPLVLPGLGQPYSLAVSPLDQSAWICNLEGSLLHYSAAGDPLPSGNVNAWVSPIGVTVSSHDFSVWVCDQGGNHVWHLNSAGNTIATVILPSPWRVAADSLSGDAWVTSGDNGRVWRLSALGSLLDSTVVASGPVGIAADPRRGRLWVADALGNRVFALDPQSLAVQFVVPGLAGVRDVAVDLATGEAWVVARASAEIVRLSPVGVVLGRTGGFSDPTEVRLDPGQ